MNCKTPSYQPKGNQSTDPNFQNNNQLVSNQLTPLNLASTSGAVASIANTNKTTTFHDLNNDCFLLILQKFSLAKMIPLRKVCSRWNGLIEYQTSRRHNLKIFEDLGSLFIKYVHHIGESPRLLDGDFQLHRLGDDLDDTLVERWSSQMGYTFPAHLFPFVTKLVLYHEQPSTLLNHLLVNCDWNTRLESLCLTAPPGKVKFCYNINNNQIKF